ncbi:hypothetical protein [Archangium sp.]|uniref:hypothetical protein n=1 Tax=Archangium sp. TaxID=1872627 RepID=UPI002D6F3199|nr:hypothetical protein [Archangium sp.]HYO56559.1 hypothetical protein [Archangium sp.]
MALFYVTYDLRAPGRDYRRLGDRLMQLGGRPVLESVWAVKLDATARQLFDDLRGYIDQNDRLLVINSADSAWTTNTLADPNKL